MAWKIFSGWWRRRRPNWFDEVTVTGLSRAAADHLLEIAYAEMEKDPAVQRAMWENTARMFSSLAVGAARMARGEPIGEPIGFRLKKKTAEKSEPSPASPSSSPPADCAEPSASAPETPAPAGPPDLSRSLPTAPPPGAPPSP